MSINHRLLLENNIKQLDKDYNEDLKLVRTGFFPNRYHIKMEHADFVHDIRESLAYALALLSSEKEVNVSRAIDILNTILPMQDKRINSPTFGIWSWYYEEPVNQMLRPDFNMADFDGKLLILMAMYHNYKFNKQLQDDIRESIFNACKAIIKRDVRIGYTNICIMDCLVTLFTGEYYNYQSYIDYAINKLEKFY